MAKPSDPIVIIHSSCRDDVADTKKTSESSFTTTAAVDEDEDILALLPISCDVLIMPEIPGEHNSSQIEPNGYHPLQLLELLENQFNPCGVSNVLLLENFPWRNVLLSLTSCNIEYDDVSLPVEPIPSTFDFSFPEGMRNYQTTQQELALEFDLSMARSQLLLEGRQAPLLEQERLEEESARGGLTTKVIEALPSPGSISQEPPTVNTHDEKPTPSATSATKDKKKRNDSECPSSPDMRLVDSFYTEMCMTPLQERRSHVRSHEQRLVLSQLQAMMEKDTNDLDRMISVLAVVGLFLLLLLGWSGYQLYRSTKREEQMEDIRESVHKRILTQIGASAMSLGPLALDSLSKKAESPPSVVRVQKQWASDDSSKSKLSPKLLEESFEWWDSDDSGDIQLSPKFMEESSEQKRLVSSDEPKEWHVGETTPRVSNRCVARPRAPQIPAQVTPPREHPLRALPTQANNGTNDDHFVASPTRDAQIFAQVTPPREHHVNVFLAQPHGVKVAMCERKECPKERKIPAQATRSPEPPIYVLPTQSPGCKLGRSEVQGSNVTTDGQILTANAPEKKYLSPCSKLAQEWAEKKTARRSNRRKNQQKLEPLSVKSTGNHDAGEQPVKNFLISRHPTDESRSSSRLLGPPTLRSITKGRDFEAHLNSRRNRPVATDRPLNLKPSPFKTSTFSTEEEEDPFVSQERADPGKRHFLTPDFSRSSESPACGPTLPELCSTPGSEDSFVDDYW